MATKAIDVPSKVIFERDDTTGSSCTQTVCPECPSGQECQQRAATRDQCAEYYCASMDDGNSKGTPVGAIVGGVIGGLVAVGIIAAGMLYYKLVYRKKHPALDDDEDLMMDGMSHVNRDDNSELDSHKGDLLSESGSGGGSIEKTPTRRNNPNNTVTNRRRLSSYESFTRPKRGGKNSASNLAAAQRRARQKQIVKQANATNLVYMDPQSNNRNSVATTISTTHASNILPIAYIPGVTVRPTKNNTRSIYSYDSESIFSDLNTIENASIIGDVMRANNHNGSPTDTAGDKAQNNKNSTMTAIKVQPRLVNVDRIEEEDDEYTDDDDESCRYSYPTQDSSFEKSNNSSTNVTTHVVNTSGLSNVTSLMEEDETDDSDVDSDIGEITRATSVRKAQPRKQDREILLDIPLNQASNDIPMEHLHSYPISLHDNNSSRGSFLLDVEMDDRNISSDNSSKKSPFEDPIQ